MPEGKPEPDAIAAAVHRKVPGAQFCSRCGAELARHERIGDGVCRRHACRAAVARDNVAEAQRRRLARLAKAATAEARRRFGPNVEAARTPYNRAISGPADPAVHRAFANRLAGAFRTVRGDADLLARAASMEFGPLRPDGDPEAAPGREGIACAACRGECCRLGAGHAFLDKMHLARLIVRNADKPAARMYRDYLRRLPRRSVVGSCPYHGEKGCVLPREKLARVCNSWQCDDLYALQNRLKTPEGGAARIAVVAADDKGVGPAIMIEDARPSRTGSA